MSQSIWADMKCLVKQVFESSTYEEGEKGARAFMSRLEGCYPSAMACLGEDLEASLGALRFPGAHRKRIRTTDLLEWLLGEGECRTKVSPCFPGGAACLCLLYATLVKASENWHGVKIAPESLRRLDALRRQPVKECEKELVAVLEMVKNRRSYAVEFTGELT